MPIYTIRVSYRSSVAASERESETESETWAIPLFVESIAGKVRNQRILLRFILLDGLYYINQALQFFDMFSCSFVVFSILGVPFMLISVE